MYPHNMKRKNAMLGETVPNNAETILDVRVRTDYPQRFEAGTYLFDKTGFLIGVIKTVKS